jgi:hypothetical protein
MKVPEKYRVKTGPMASDSSYGCNGYFFIPKGDTGLNVIASDGMGWEHVSVSKYMSEDLPSWYELVMVKNLFWDEEETVIQFIPKKSEHRSIGEVLHMWKKSNHEYELPPGITVAPKLIGGIK